MKFFVYNYEKINTLYHEFQKGHFDGKTFWKEDSICLYDDLLYLLGLEDFFIRVIPDYCSTDEIEVNPQIWENVKKEAEKIGGDIQECIAEADKWVKDTFREYDIFTIIGI